MTANDITLLVLELVLVGAIFLFLKFWYWAAHSPKMPSYDRQFDATQARRVTTDKTSNADDLEKLVSLKESGDLSESEFESEKQKILTR